MNTAQKQLPQFTGATARLVFALGLAFKCIGLEGAKIEPLDADRFDSYEFGDECPATGLQLDGDLLITPEMLAEVEADDFYSSRSFSVVPRVRRRLVWHVGVETVVSNYPHEPDDVEYTEVATNLSDLWQTAKLAALALADRRITFGFDYYGERMYALEDERLERELMT